MTDGVRRWVAGATVAGGAAVAAAVVGTSVARADTIDGFLVQAEDDMSQIGTLFAGLDSSSTSATANVVASFQGQAELISQFQTQQDGFSQAVQTGSQLLSADQQLADASGNLVAASQTLVNAADAGDIPLSTTESLTDKLTGLHALFGFLDVEFFQVLPAELNVTVDTVADGGTLDLTGLTPSAAASTGADPATLLSQGNADLAEANTVLSAIDTSGQPSDIASLVPSSTQIVGSQEQVMAAIANLQDTIVQTQAQSASMPGYNLVTEATNALFTSADQNLLNADAALLAADQSLASAISSGAGLTDTGALDTVVSMLDTVGADFSAFRGTLDAAFTPFLELFASA